MPMPVSAFVSPGPGHHEARGDRAVTCHTLHLYLPLPFFFPCSWALFHRSVRMISEFRDQR